MTLKGKNLITIDDFFNAEVDVVFSLAEEMMSSPRDYSDLCKGFVMASLFYEPSTRTRLSFETAMHRLGGSVVTAAEVGSSSLAKGESLADTARVVGSYVDLIVIRHPWEGAAQAIANYAGISVINAGDGSHEHPTQTLCDLFTLRKEKGTIRDLTIAMCGDLKSGRTVHSLTYALAKFGANIVFMPSKGYELPRDVREKLGREYKGVLSQSSESDKYESGRTPLGDLDAIYQTSTKPHQLTLLTDIALNLQHGDYDVIYATRLQKERYSSEEKGGGYVKLDQQMMKQPAFKKTLVMHPLPRVDEIAHELDEDPRSMYFKQAAYGVPVRMALLSLILGAVERDPPEEPNPYFRGITYQSYKSPDGIACDNDNCVSHRESAYIVPEFWIISENPAILRCVYCERESQPQSAGSSRTRFYHKAGDFSSRRLKDKNIVFFESYKQAHDAGYRPGSRVKTRQTQTIA